MMKSTQRFFASQVMIVFGIVMLFSLNAKVAKAQWTTTSNGDATNNNSSGKVGIGTAAPSEPLQVNNVVRISPYSPNTSGSYVNAGAVLRLLNGNIYQSGGSEISGIQFGGMYNPNGTQTDAFYNYVDWSGGWLRIRNNQQTKIQIGAGDEWGRQDIYFNPSGGNVGIGTTSPQALLNVHSATADSTAVQLAITGGVTGDRDLDFRGVHVSNDGSNKIFGRIRLTSDGSFTQSGELGFFTGQNDGSNNITLSERLRIKSNGNVGIGTTSPGQRLSVNYNTSNALPGMSVSETSGGSTGLTVNNTNTSGNSGVLFNVGDANKGRIKVDNSGRMTLNGSGFGDDLTINSAGNVGIGTATPTTGYKLDVQGDVRVSGNITAKYQDVAEWVPASEQLSAGTVVVLDSTKSNQVISSGTSYDTRVAGVISERPGIALGEKSEGKVLVATTGRVRVKVDATKGPIHIGDLLVTSDVSGVAMKSEPVEFAGRKMHMPGTLIGKALEPLEKGKGEILVLLSLQ